MGWKPEGTEWVDYYDGDSYSGDAAQEKSALVRDYLEKTSAGVVWDLGANTGVCSRIAASLGADVVSLDGDPACVERNYLETTKGKESSILPFCMDLANPSPSLGWEAL